MTTVCQGGRVYKCIVNVVAEQICVAVGILFYSIVLLYVMFYSIMLCYVMLCYYMLC